MNETERQFRELATRAEDLRAALALMNWDQEIHMPAGAAGRRARQQAGLSVLLHELEQERLAPLARKLRDADDGADPRRTLNLRQLVKDLEKRGKLPSAFVEKLTQAASESQHAWEEARRARSFAHFAPHLEKLAGLKQEEAEYLGYEATPYDALLDDYEPGMTAARLESVLTPVRDELRALLDKILAAPAPDDAFLRQQLARDAQWNFTLDVLRDMGFDFKRGRQDVSTHPFTTSFGMEDVRVTTRIKSDDLSEALSSSIHEGGHALYEQGINPEAYGLPEGHACSLSIHESQSRAWENNVGRSLGFFQHYFPQIAAVYPDGLAGKTPEDLFRAFNKVGPSYIRTAADELTYHFHILLRYELERALLEKKLKVADLPEAWNAKINEYLGLPAPAILEGALQDVHWSIGAFGYFPTYSLGSFYAAQLFAAAKKTLPDLEGQIARGEFLPFKQWLNENIHAEGRLYDSETLCTRATGEPLNARYFLEYLKEKYARAYGIPL